MAYAPCRWNHTDDCADKDDVEHVIFLGEEFLADDYDATFVLVFPLSTERGGVVDEEADVQEPLLKARRLFVRQRNPASAETLESGFESFRGADAVSAGDYQEVVRAKVLEILTHSGFRVASFCSHDGDEVFVKICLARQGSVIRQMAERFNYRMPFKDCAYAGLRPFGDLKRDKPMRNKDGRSIPAYAEYEEDNAAFFEPFREVDEIRIIFTRLDRWVHLQEMTRQGVLKSYFPAANHRAVAELHGIWASPRKTLQVQRFPEDIRNYFGEEIAFFFGWFGFYIQMLVPMALLSLVLFFLHPVLDYQLLQKVRIGYAMVVVVWASFFNKLYRRHAARAKQAWGVYELKETEMEHSDYRPELEGTWRQALRNCVAPIVVVGYCLLFVGLVYVAEVRQKEETEQGRVGIFTKYGSLFTALLIKFSLYSWGQVCGLLVSLQNHRTHRERQNSLTFVLSTVKIFVALYPFMAEAFIWKWSRPTCAETLQEAARRIWAPYADGGQTWPQDALTNLEKYFSYKSTDGKVCVHGCYPNTPYISIEMIEETNCLKALKRDLAVFYALHVVVTALCILYPIVATRIAVKEELAKVQEMEDEELCDAQGPRPYSLLQFQAKCQEQARYGYDSWGGSFVEDYLELAIGFALFTCFGILLPLLSVFALLANLVEYRLLAFRMLHVTSRPMPLSADGIGHWQAVFGVITYIAVMCNVGLAVFVMAPMGTKSPKNQVIVFIFMEHLMLLLKVVVQWTIPDDPSDVKRIEHFNAHFIRNLMHQRQMPLHIPPTEKCDFTRVDLGHFTARLEAAS